MTVTPKDKSGQSNTQPELAPPPFCYPPSPAWGPNLPLSDISRLDRHHGPTPGSSGSLTPSPLLVSPVPSAASIWHRLRCSNESQCVSAWDVLQLALAVLGVMAELLIIYCRHRARVRPRFGVCRGLSTLVLNLFLARLYSCG